MQQRVTVAAVMRAVMLARDDKELRAQLAALLPGKVVVLKVLEDLDSAGKSSPALRAYADAAGWLVAASRGGRPAPKPGDKRIYKVTAGARGGKPIIRIGVSCLGLAEGDYAESEFEADKITTRIKKKALGAARRRATAA